MGIGEITKQFAKEAIGEQVKDLLGGPEPSSQQPQTATPAAASTTDGLSSVLMAQLQAMQNVLKDDQELVVHCNLAGGESIRVLEVFAPSPKVLVLTGQDRDKALARIITPADAVQMICRPAAVSSGSKPQRIRFIVPQPKNPKA